MKHFPRWLFKVLAVIASLLSLAAAIDVPISYWKGASLTVRFWPHGIIFEIGTERDTLGLGLISINPFRWIQFNIFNATPEFNSHSFLNFMYISQRGMVLVGVPLWLCALVLGWFGWWCFRRRNPLAAGLCSVCGYDLRATPDRCPECGTVPANILRA